MTTLKIPGVYVEEVPTLPPGVAEVSSAIPAFIGYTESTIYNQTDLLNKPIKVQSMLEFTRIFGGASPLNVKNVTADLNQTDQNAILEKTYFLFDSLQMYFLNGGGPCYIVSVGNYDSAKSADHFTAALDALDFFDEPTLYLFPDAATLNTVELAGIQQSALMKSSLLMDRFCLLDVPNKNGVQDVEGFRNNIGMANLKYGAAYTPWINTVLNKKLVASEIEGIFTLLEGQDASILNFEVNGVTIKDTITAYKDYIETLEHLKTNDVSLSFYDLLDNTFINTFASSSDNIFDPDSDPGENRLVDGISDLSIKPPALKTVFDKIITEKITTWKGEYTALGSDTDNKRTYMQNLLNDPEFQNFRSVYSYVKSSTTALEDAYETMFREHIPFYASLLQILNGKFTAVPPSGVMAGLICKVDQDRGVWKAPANISVSSARSVTQLYSKSDQEGLNVDPVAGKSINVIRPITGYGIMVMGARTLAGNDSEWRYIPVRRLFIFIEENLKKSTGWAVFEPNDKLLWLKVRTQIENYLFDMWRRGALAGAKPEHAYQVECGLNSTMTAENVLKGELIINVKLAAVRPAEFILLKFSHQLQKS